MQRYVLPLCLGIVCTASAHAVNSAITISVTVAVRAIDVDWLLACRTGSDTATVLNWTLGNQAASVTIDSQTSTNFGRVCTVESLGADVTVNLKCSNASPATAWTLAGSAGANQFRMQAKGGSGTGNVFSAAYADLTTSDQLLIPVLANAANTTFYLKFYSPSSSTDSTSKTITVTATATSPP